MGNNPMDGGDGTCYSRFVALDIAYAIPGWVLGDVISPIYGTDYLQLVLRGAASYFIIKHILLKQAGWRVRMIMQPFPLMGFGAGYFMGKAANMGVPASLAMGGAAGALFSEIKYTPRDPMFVFRSFAHERDMFSAGFDGTPGIHKNPISLHQDP